MIAQIFRMKRFLPADAYQRSLGNPKFAYYLTLAITELCRELQGRLWHDRAESFGEAVPVSARIVPLAECNFTAWEPAPQAGLSTNQARGFETVATQDDSSENKPQTALPDGAPVLAAESLSVVRDLAEAGRDSAEPACAESANNYKLPTMSMKKPRLSYSASRRSSLKSVKL